MAVALGELATRFGCELRGDPGTLVERVGTLANADNRSIAFLSESRNRRELTATRAAAVILESAAADACPTAALICANPRATFARITSLLHPPPAHLPGVHPSAIVSPMARIDATAHIGVLAVVGDRAVIGPRVYVGPGSIVEEDVALAEDVRLVASVTLCRGVTIGARTVIQPGVVIGGDGFGFAPEQGRWVKVPQIGSVRIGPDVEIGANTTIDRGAIEDTVVEEGVKLDNQIQIGHNCHIGAHTVMAACVGIAGSTKVGRNVMIGGAAMIQGHIEIADGVTVSASTMVMHSLRKKGVYTAIFPIDDHASWEKNAVTLRNLYALRERVRALEKKE
ncbi:MAG: UDP-3-O-(3-hydroxymyristoyl)glucosamine N-acyltransferase [Pseudomonadota bacterium]|nr:UDP-3-O-(3-hydroxymyristoyl)glucosamine N-acyltransferase [Pseudomonadota bacterium]